MYVTKAYLYNIGVNPWIQDSRRTTLYKRMIGTLIRHLQLGSTAVGSWALRSAGDSCRVMLLAAAGIELCGGGWRWMTLALLGTGRRIAGIDYWSPVECSYTERPIVRVRALIPLSVFQDRDKKSVVRSTQQSIGSASLAGDELYKCTLSVAPVVQCAESVNRRFSGFDTYSFTLFFFEGS